MKQLIFIASLAALIVCSNSRAAMYVVVTQGEEWQLAAGYSTDDVLQGLIGIELEGDHGWHSANADPADQLAAFTDGAGIRSTGLTGLLNDFPGEGQPAKKVEYALAAPHDIAEIRVFTGNNGRDGRVFHTYTVSFLSDGGQNFSEPIYVQSHPSGTLNNSQNNQWHAVLSQLADDTGPLARNVTHLRFSFYSVDNTGGQMRDPFSGTNPFTGLDDGFSAAFVSPLVWEIDVLGEESPPRLTASIIEANLRLSWNSEQDYVLQFSNDLGSGEWASLDPQPEIVHPGDGTSFTVIPLGGGIEFYRLRK